MIYRNILGRIGGRSQPTTIVRVAPAGLPALDNTSNRFQLNSSSGWLQVSAASAGGLALAAPELPIVGKLLEARFRVSGGAVRAALPTTRPTVQVVRMLHNSAHQLGVTVTDISASVAAYEASHELVVSFNLDLRAVDFDWIALNVTGETGVGSENNQFRLYCVDLVLSP